MLVRFNVSNFLSFNSVQEFSMISGKVRSKKHHVEEGSIKLLKLGAIFGANASGKSNIVRAMNFARFVVRNGIDSRFLNSYFRLDDKNIDVPSYFEFEIEIENKYYAYGFEVLLNKGEFISEWLYKLSPNSNFVIFERDLVKGTYNSEIKFSDSETKKRMEVYSKDVENLPNVLFLTEMNRNKDQLYKKDTELNIFRDVFKWFEKNLDINYPDRPISNYSYFYNESNSENISKIIKAFGTGITDFNIVETPIEEITKLFPKQLINDLEKDINKMVMDRKNDNSEKFNSITLRINDDMYIISINEKLETEVRTIVFEHDKKNTFFKLSEESDGTRRIIDLLEILLSDDQDKVYIIDEIDRSLHPQLTYKLIESFLNLATKRKNQLIVTTHESRLLDFDLLRRDEIWFIDKNECGESSIYSLDAYNERFDKKIDKAYLEGRYGGVPIFSTVFPVKGGF